MTVSCPECGWETDELPEPVYIDGGPRTKGHSDQSTHVCPECDHEGWNQGWMDDRYPEDDD